ncbi:Hypothetical protein NCS54_01210300 [Fusarium falciforme]|uniref:Hypothetical protein n=1 Tax=Fusarium falciforme TaxID=195108 RepID=UPI0023018095|nr:Hypothetical protein NCS54_01210300 [Fusarium falciforme]WAO94516.1 Hypothetical protein NCS54_01210300 [Fusarium falciforme]
MPSTSQAALSTTHSTTTAALFIAALSPGSFSRDSSSLTDRESLVGVPSGPFSLRLFANENDAEDRLERLCELAREENLGTVIPDSQEDQDDVFSSLCVRAP